MKNMNNMTVSRRRRRRRIDITALRKKDMNNTACALHLIEN